jgi:hypothetical protein
MRAAGTGPAASLTRLFVQGRSETFGPDRNHDQQPFEPKEELAGDIGAALAD